MNTLTRDEAIEKLEGYLSAERAKIAEPLRNRLESDWERCRNYELEARLERYIGGEWVITTWCPFNGIFCNAIEYIDEKGLRETISEFKEAKKTQAYGKHLNYDYHVNILRHELKRRGLPVA